MKLKVVKYDATETEDEWYSITDTDGSLLSDSSFILNRNELIELLNDIKMVLDEHKCVK
jgi:hypothetical protein